jgi:uncharacterized lipoprotein YajG
MRAKRSYLIRLIGLMSTFLMLAGCATTYTIKSSDIPQLQTGSPLKSVSPRTFAIKGIRDVRGANDSYMMLQNLGSGFVQITLDQPAATVVAMSIRKELERNGHKCILNSPEAKPDFLVKGTVYKFGLKEDMSYFSQSVSAQVAVKLTISSASDEKKIFTKNYEGEYHIDGSLADVQKETGKDYEKILDRALLDMLREISTDHDLIEFIGK